jgi:hypothetical protein
LEGTKTSVYFNDFISFSKKIKYLNFAAQINILITGCIKAIKNNVNAKLRIDGDFYPCAF